MSALAAAHATGAFELPFALFGISISGILKTIAKLLFSVLAGALLPDWLKHAPDDALRWLIALPDPAVASQWPTMHRLEQDTTAVAVALLPLTFAIAVLRYTASGITGGAHHPAESIGRLVAAAAGLLLLPWAFQNAIAGVNVTTHALLSFHAVSEGLTRALALMFAGGVAFGVTGPVVALLVIGAILLAVGLVIIKVGILALFAVLYVAGPLALALSPVPELHGAWRAWLGVVTALALIPVGWCLIFAVAGALSADITHIGTPAAIGARLVGFFAGVLTFFIAFRWPFFLIAMVRSRGLLSGELIGTRGAGTAAAAGSPGERVRQARAALMAGAGAAGQAVSHVGAALGMPRGGVAGTGARAAGRAVRTAAATPLALRGRQGLAASWQAVRRQAGGDAGAPTAAGQRLQAAATVAAAGPAAVRAAMAERGSPAAARAAAEQVLTGARTGARQPPAGPRAGTAPNRPGGTSPASRTPAARSAPPSPTPARSGAVAAVDAAAATAAAQTAARAARMPNAPQKDTPPRSAPASRATARPLESTTPKPSAPDNPGPARRAQTPPPPGPPQPSTNAPRQPAPRQRPQPSPPPQAAKSPPAHRQPPPPQQRQPRRRRRPKGKGRGR